MARKIFSVVCIATIATSATVGLFLRLRMKKDARGQVEEETEREDVGSGTRTGGGRVEEGEASNEGAGDMGTGKAVTGHETEKEVAADPAFVPAVAPGGAAETNEFEEAAGEPGDAEVARKGEDTNATFEASATSDSSSLGDKTVSFVSGGRTNSNGRNRQGKSTAAASGTGVVFVSTPTFGDSNGRKQGGTNMTGSDARKGETRPASPITLTGSGSAAASIAATNGTLITRQPPFASKVNSADMKPKEKVETPSASPISPVGSNSAPAITAASNGALIDHQLLMNKVNSGAVEADGRVETPSGTPITPAGSNGAAASNAASFGTSICRCLPLGTGNGRDMKAERKDEMPTTTLGTMASNKPAAAASAAATKPFGTRSFGATRSGKLPLRGMKGGDIPPEREGERQSTHSSRTSVAAASSAAGNNAAAGSSAIAGSSAVAGSSAAHSSIDGAAPSLAPVSIFKERKQTWTLSSEAKALFDACKVSPKDLFLAKCVERFGHF